VFTILKGKNTNHDLAAGNSKQVIFTFKKWNSYLKGKGKLGVMVQACNPSTEETEAGEFSRSRIAWTTLQEPVSKK
jgi:hypothetical protein